jgi:predicted metalloprotease
MRNKLCSAAAIVLLLAACGGPKPAGSASSTANLPDTDSIQIHGDKSDPVNKLAVEAIADLQQWWSEQMPKTYDGEHYEPVKGGFYAAMPSSGELPPCAQDAQSISGTAFYCPSRDVVAWDAEGLLPSLKEKFGDFIIPVVLAHEWGHAIQARTNFYANTVTKEIQADCFAGAWVKHAQQDKVFEVSSSDLDAAAAGLLDLRDAPGGSANDPGAHGSGFDRVGSFQNGYDNGAQACKGYRDGDPPVLELPFTDSLDAARGGDAPYDSIINGVPYDLEDYWSKVYPELTGQPWVPVKGLQPFAPNNPPMCGGKRADGYALFYCAPDDYIGWDNVQAMPRIYDQGGDYAVATLLATQYALAAIQRANDQSDEKTSDLRADCFAGAYTASVILGNRSESSSYRISPGDLDEALKALLVFRGEGDVERQGAGWDRVKAFRDGVVNGAKPCTDLKV